MQLRGGLSYFCATFSPQFSAMVECPNLISQIWVKIGPCRRQDHCVLKSQINPRVSRPKACLLGEGFSHMNMHTNHMEILFKMQTLIW